MNNRIAQIYGYAVCFITVIVMLIAIKSVVDAAFDLSDPIRAEGNRFRPDTPSLTSFELYKIQSRRPGPNYAMTTVSNLPGPVAVVRGGPATQASTTSGKATADTLSDAELRRRYDAEREGVIGDTRFSATRSLVGNFLLIVLAGVLFVVHWRWLKGRDDGPPSVYRASPTSGT